MSLYRDEINRILDVTEAAADEANAQVGRQRNTALAKVADLERELRDITVERDQLRADLDAATIQLLAQAAAMPTAGTVPLDPPTPPQEMLT